MSFLHKVGEHAELDEPAFAGRILELFPEAFAISLEDAYELIRQHEADVPSRKSP
jgi:hypothetical protein